MCFCKVCAKIHILVTKTWYKSHKTGHKSMQGSSECFYVPFILIFVVLWNLRQKFGKSHEKSQELYHVLAPIEGKDLGQQFLLGIVLGVLEGLIKRGFFWFSILTPSSVQCMVPPSPGWTPCPPGGSSREPPHPDRDTQQERHQDSRGIVSKMSSFYIRIRYLNNDGLVKGSKSLGNPPFMCVLA